MRKIYADIDAATTQIMISGHFARPSSWSGRIVATDKNGVVTVMSSTANYSFYDKNVIFCIPTDWAMENHLPANIELEIRQGDEDWREFKTFILVLPYREDWDGDGRGDTPTTGGGNTGGTGTVVFPNDYPLPSSQVVQLTPQKDALTEGQLRSEPLDVRTLSLLVDSVRQTLTPSLPATFNLLGPVVSHVAIPANSSQRIRLIRNAGHVDPEGDAFPIVTIKLGDTIIYCDKLEPGLPWSETVCFEGGLGDDLTVTLSANINVYFNFRYEYF